jgi:hypothetical protein
LGSDEEAFGTHLDVLLLLAIFQQVPLLRPSSSRDILGCVLDHFVCVTKNLSKCRIEKPFQGHPSQTQEKEQEIKGKSLKNRPHLY